MARVLWNNCAPGLQSVSHYGWHCSCPFRKLQSKVDSSIPFELLQAVYQLPPFLLERSDFREMVKRAASKLEAMFLDLEVTWQKEELWDQFIKLPAAAVKALLGLDTLAVVSENTVLLALLCWLKAQPHKVPAGVRAELVSLIRLQHLTPAYWAHVLPHFPFVANGVPEQHMRAVQAFMNVSKGGASGSNVREREWHPRRQPPSRASTLRHHPRCSHLPADC